MIYKKTRILLHYIITLHSYIESIIITHPKNEKIQNKIYEIPTVSFFQ